MTLEGWAANVSVAKQWQAAGRQRCLAGLLKTSEFPDAMQSKMTTKSLGVQQMQSQYNGSQTTAAQSSGKCFCILVKGVLTELGIGDRLECGTKRFF